NWKKYGMLRHSCQAACTFSRALTLRRCARRFIISMKARALVKTARSDTAVPILHGNGAMRSLPYSVSVDQVMAEERAVAFTKRSIKTSTKLVGLKLAVAMMDLTTLEGKDTPGKVAYLSRKALQPAEPKYNVPPCA